MKWYNMKQILSAKSRTKSKKNGGILGFHYVICHLVLEYQLYWNNWFNTLDAYLLLNKKENSNNEFQF